MKRAEKDTEMVKNDRATPRSALTNFSVALPWNEYGGIFSRCATSAINFATPLSQVVEFYETENTLLLSDKAEKV